MPKLKVYRCSTMDLPLGGGPWVSLEDLKKCLKEPDENGYWEPELTSSKDNHED